MPASEVEQALLKLGERYSVFPTPQDFGSHKKSLDLHQVFAVDDKPPSTSFVSYRLTFVNTAGDTVHIWNSVYRDYELIGDYHFPWLLPMVVHTPNASFVSYQPCRCAKVFSWESWCTCDCSSSFEGGRSCMQRRFCLFTQNQLLNAWVYKSHEARQAGVT